VPTLETPILPIQLPPGYTARPVTLDDAEAAAAMANAYAIALTGRPSIEAGEIRSDWGQPTMSLATNTLAVFAPDGVMAGLAEVWDSEPHVQHFVFAEVHPAHQGLGIGTGLARWAEARGRQLLAAAPEDARVIVRQFKMSSDEAAGRLLQTQGYMVVRHNLRMAIDFDGPPPQPALPTGLTIRPFVRGQEDRALLLAVREEFRDHWGNVEQPLEQDYREWQHFMDTSPTCDPTLFFVAVDGDEIAGTALGQTAWAEDPEAGWIYALGVRRPWRRRGVALALLQQCFVAFHERGKRRARLGVDAQSLTGATRLYEKAGMHMERQYDFYEKELRPGRDLSTRALA
jgi:mycothiol synthase